MKYGRTELIIMFSHHAKTFFKLEFIRVRNSL